MKAEVAAEWCEKNTTSKLTHLRGLLVTSPFTYRPCLLLLPYELMGSHAGAAPASARTLSVTFGALQAVSVRMEGAG